MTASSLDTRTCSRNALRIAARAFIVTLALGASGMVGALVVSGASSSAAAIQNPAIQNPAIQTPAIQTTFRAEDPQSDPSLNQTIDPNQAQGTGQVVRDDGHIDFGPTLNTGKWAVQIHDDTAVPSYWRMPRDVVAQVRDSSQLTIPESETYAFLGLEPGTEAWVIPQVRKPGVIWAGWNTQEPGALDALAMGTKLTVLGVEGPGEVSVYLQSGNFGEPQPLWSTLQPFPQDTWIEANSHTHANWVFSKPGIYLVEVQFSADLKDGTAVSAKDHLRFAVGDEVDPAAAFAATPKSAGGNAGEVAGDAGEDDATGGQDRAAPANGTENQTGGLFAGVEPVFAAVGIALAVAVVSGIVVVAVAARRGQKRAREAARQRAAQRQTERDAGQGGRDPESPDGDEFGSDADAAANVEPSA